MASAGQVKASIPVPQPWPGDISGPPEGHSSIGHYQWACMTLDPSLLCHGWTSCNFGAVRPEQCLSQGSAKIRFLRQGCRNALSAPLCCAWDVKVGNCWSPTVLTYVHQTELETFFNSGFPFHLVIPQEGWITDFTSPENAQRQEPTPICI